MPVSKTNQMLKIELLLDEDLSRFLRIEYEQRGLTLRQISKKIEKLTGYLIDPVVILFVVKDNMKLLKVIMLMLK